MTAKTAPNRSDRSLRTRRSPPNRPESTKNASKTAPNRSDRSLRTRRSPPNRTESTKMHLKPLRPFFPCTEISRGDCVCAEDFRSLTTVHARQLQWMWEPTHTHPDTRKLTPPRLSNHGDYAQINFTSAKIKHTDRVLHFFSC